MIDSILTSVKKSIGGIDEGFEGFDPDIILLINSELATLCQLGVGPKEGFRIEGKDEKWTDFVNDDRLNFIKEYVMIRVKLVFDPPQSSIVTEVYKEKSKELQWRLNVAAEQLMDGDD